MQLLPATTAFKMKGEHNHAAVHFINYIGVAERFISAVNIAQAVAKFYFRREDEVRKENLKPYSTLNSVVALFYRDNIF